MILPGQSQVQMKGLNHLNVFCIHATHSGDLDLERLSIEALRQQFMIPDGCLSLGEYAVVVRNVPEFISRMRGSAKANGYPMWNGLVKYYDPSTFHKQWPLDTPEAAFCKQNEFSFQREYRFAIDDGTAGDDPLLMDIGDISDISLQLPSSELSSDKWPGEKLKIRLAQ